MTSSSVWSSALRRRVYLVAALLLGALGSFAHPPHAFEPAILLPLIAAFFLLVGAERVRDAWCYGWALGIGYFSLTLSWISEPFQIDAVEMGWMGPLAVLSLAVLLGMFWAGAMAFALWVSGNPVVLVFTWTGAEILRAYLFTGFPWASPPQALVGTLAGQALAFFGPHGLMFLCVSLAFLIGTAQRFWLRIGSLFIAVVMIISPPISASSALTSYTVRLVQPNAPQDEKWLPESIPIFESRLINYTAEGLPPDLVIWPETALSYLEEDAQFIFDDIAEAARGSLVVLGIQRRHNEKYFNSLVVLDSAGEVVQTYDKHRLVPFGEYMPFDWFFRYINVGGLAARTELGYTSGSGPSILNFGALGAALPLICYEAVFAHAVGGTEIRPNFLIQLTNDAWFGNWSGPQQHLAQARMRAIEQGLPMVRVANTGISALIDPKGRVTASLGLGTAGYLDVKLPQPGASTLYSYTGDWPWITILILGLWGSIIKRTLQGGKIGVD